MSSTVLLSKGAGQIYIMAVTAEGRGVDDDMPPYTRTFVLALYRLGKGKNAKMAGHYNSRTPLLSKLLLGHSSSYGAVISLKLFHVQTIPSTICTSRSAIKPGVFVNVFVIKSY